MVKTNLKLGLTFREYMSEVVVGYDVRPTDVFNDVGGAKKLPMVTVAKWFRGESLPTKRYCKLLCDRYDYSLSLMLTWVYLKSADKLVVDFLDRTFTHRSETTEE